MRTLIIIITGVVVVGGLTLLRDAGDGENMSNLHAQSAAPSSQASGSSEINDGQVPSGVCSMDPRYRPRPGQRSCRSTP